MTSLNKGRRPYEVSEILNYDLDGEKAKTLANAELQQLKKEYLDCERKKREIESDLSYYREGNIPKNIAGLFFVVVIRTSLNFKLPNTSPIKAVVYKYTFILIILVIQNC